MNPETRKRNIPEFPEGRFSHEYVLDYYDGPRMTLRRSGAGQVYLAWWSSYAGDTERWLYLPVSRARLEDILSGRIPALEAMENAADGSLLAVEIEAGSGAPTQAFAVNVRDLPPDSLPGAGARLNIPLPPGAREMWTDGAGT